MAALRDLSPAAVLDYRARRLTTAVAYPWRAGKKDAGPAKFPSNRTVNMEVNALSTMLNWAVRHELIGRNPLLGVKPLPQRERDLRKRRRPLSEAEIERFLTAVREMDVGRIVPQEPMWRLFCETGLRWGEATALRPEHLRDATLYLPADETKSGKGRVVPLRPELAARLDLPLRMPNGKPWGRGKNKNAQTQMEAALRRAGIPYAPTGATVREVDIQALRKTTATCLAQRGVALTTLQALLGHSDPRITQRHYVHVGVEEMRRAVCGTPSQAVSDAAPKPSR